MKDSEEIEDLSNLADEFEVEACGNSDQKQYRTKLVEVIATFKTFAKRGKDIHTASLTVVVADLSRIFLEKKSLKYSESPSPRIQYGRFPVTSSNSFNSYEMDGQNGPDLRLDNDGEALQIGTLEKGDLGKFTDHARYLCGVEMALKAWSSAVASKAGITNRLGGQQIRISKNYRCL
ncbi:hypothetical protein L218DRAFT_984319 [Marasmius fiardii PR-910]|nr:hypothetical protein L218DRAFT_984319 [Marasmius fiardii PR-910]